MKRQILIGDVIEQLKTLPDESIQTVVTSPPYWGLRDYGLDKQIGHEPTPQEYVNSLVKVFDEIHRVLKSTGTLWLNLGDSYASVHTGGHKSAKSSVGANHDGAQEIRQPKASPKSYGLKDKDLVGIPWRVAFALQEKGWYLRQDIIWAKPNVMPESVRDRCTKSHEYLFLLTKSQKYYYDHIAIKEPVSEVSLKRALSGWKTNRPSAKTSPQGIDVEVMGKRFVNPEGRNKRDVWFIPTASYKGAHFAVMPEKLVEPCILAGSREDDLVLDPFMGSGTVGVVAERHNRHFVGIELNPEYVELALTRLDGKGPTLWG
jgi:DNA modification methylase